MHSSNCRTDVSPLQYSVYFRSPPTPACHVQTEPQGGDFTQPTARVPAPKWAEPVMRPQYVNNMPAASRETESRKETTDSQQNDRESRPRSHNVVSLISQLADDNLTLVRVGISLFMRVTRA